MELQLELALSTIPGKGSDPHQHTDKNKKRSFEEAFLGVDKNAGVSRTSPLLVSEQQQINGESNEQKGKLAFSTRNAEVKDDFVVGWPPVKSWRKQFCHHNHRECATNYVNVDNSGGGVGRRSNSTYVKVKMEGVGITRKLNLSIHRSYHTLVIKLASLFGKCQANIEEYKLLYQNEEGDWLHARDVPWETFIKSVQRLKLEKNGYLL